MKKFIFLTLALSATSFCFAQFSAEPSDEIKKLNWLIGTWTGAGKMSSQGMEMDVKMTSTNSFEGPFFKTVSLSDYGVFKMEETIFTSFDAKKKKYISWAFSNFSSVPRLESGDATGTKIIMTSEPWEVMGQSMVGRGTLEKKDDTTHVFTLEFKNGEKWEIASKFEMKKS